jgi:hypothetical protein
LFNIQRMDRQLSQQRQQQQQIDSSIQQVQISMRQEGFIQLQTEQ